MSAEIQMFSSIAVIPESIASLENPVRLAWFQRETNLSESESTH